ncbi:MAG TPA: ABC transporter permease [Thermomicrobiales bacterium]|nr:ABC transporter permease [Thermomicrobiales bacterium]
MNVNFSRIWLIARREISEKITQRSFIISTAVMVVVVLALVLAPVVLSAIFGDDDGGSTADQVVVVNQAEVDNLVGSLNDFAALAGFSERVTFSEGAADLDVEAAVTDGDADGVLTVTRGDDDALAFQYTNEDAELDEAAVVTQAAAGELTLQDNLERLGVDAEQAREVRTMPNITLQAADGGSESAEDTEEGFRYAIAYASALVMYMVVLIYGMWVAQGVVAEKNSRIMEIMVNAARPTELMYGKIIGIGLAGLMQLLPILAVAGIGLYSQQALADALDVTGIDFSGIDFGAISVTLVGFFLVYFLLGFLLYAALYAGVGSLVDRQEDVQTVMTPMTFAIVIGFFAAIFTLSAPDSMVARVASIVPLTSPMAMVPRILLGDPATWEIVLSIVLLVAAGYLAVVLAARIYRMGVLMYGQKPSLKVVFQRDTIRAAR